MESDSRFSYGGVSPRMDRPMDQYVTTPVHSTLAYPRMPQTVAMGVANPLDLTSAIAHELRRSNSQPGWLQWNPQAGGSEASHDADTSGLQMPYGSFNSHQQAGAASRQQQLIPQYIPRFDECLDGPGAMQQMPARFDLSYSAPESESFVSARQEFCSRPGNGLSSVQPAHEALHTARVNSVRSSSPWIERMLQSDVTPTPCPSGQSLGLASSLRMAQSGSALGEAVSCVASQTVDLQSCHSNDMQQRSERSMRSAFSSDPQHESTMDLYADLCTDDEDLETRPMDVKRKKRMLSNRASAQRSRQRRQERLDQLEVLTAQLRVENSTLQKKLSAAIQLAKKFEDQNKNLVKKVDKLSKELEGDKKARKLSAALDECASSKQTCDAGSCEMVDGRQFVDPNLIRDGNMNDSASTPSMSRRSSGWPSGTSPNENEGDVEAVSNGNAAEVSPVRKSLSACRMGSKKRSHDQSEAPAAYGGSQCTPIGNYMGSGSPGCTSSQPSRSRPTSPQNDKFGGTTLSFLEPYRPFSYEVCNPLGLEPALRDDCYVDCLDSDRWFEYADCLM
ncbi:hypothetical protein KC19_2G092800 [Ceratodon purpureus]|uniref:BZIP domain-containing protein n=1 Tax=Ceratodon purpureus TaxID=3225 RepID=A0A8T0IU07_CERPU|nr:hypothetical protein KC19_2G092800 [Ceratodon purpureus]